MQFSLTFLISAFFIGLCGLHLFWLMGGKLGLASAIPSLNGVPAFIPSKMSILLVAFALFAAALVVAAAVDLLSLGLPSYIISAMAWILTAILAVRAIGDFRLVGFVKSVRESKFATRDTLVYSPLCVFLSAGIAILILSR